MPSPQIFFNRSIHLLVWPAFGVWDAVSGSRSGANELPPGMYAIDRPGLTAYTSAIPNPFRDQTGQGFFVAIYPLFNTTRGQTGGRLGIHPDGNVPGTDGCIGIKNDAKSFYDALRSVGGGTALILQVI